MLAATLERERKHVYDKGEADGFVKGEAAGLALGMQVQRQTILQLLQFRFTLREIEQKRLTEQLEQIQTLEQLSQLANGLLNRESKLEDFIGQLTSYLSPNQAV